MSLAVKKAASETSYKQTELGLIPSDWDILPVGRMLANKPSYGINAPATRFSVELPTYLRITDITEDGRFSRDSIASVNHPHAENYKLDIGDIVLARTGASVGKSYLYNPTDGQLVFAGFLIKIKPNSEKLSAQYLKYQLQTPAYWRWIVTNSMRSGQPGVNSQQYSNLPIPIPPTRNEQEAIAEALSDADALIESLEALVAKKRHIKQGAMQDLLTGKKRLAGFEADKEIIKDQFGTYPASWRAKRLSDLVDLNRPIRYGIVQPGRYDPNGRFMIRGQDYSLAKGWAEPSEVFRVSDSVESRYSNARVHAGDLIITIVGYCGHVEIVPPWLDGANLTQTTARLSIQKSKANPIFCMYLIRSPYVQRQVTSYLKGNAQPGLNCGDVEKFILPCPSIEEQQQIADILMEMDSDLAAIETKLEKAKQIKQGMVQDLLTGRVRLV